MFSAGQQRIKHEKDPRFTERKKIRSVAQQPGVRSQEIEVQRRPVARGARGRKARIGGQSGGSRAGEDLDDYDLEEPRQGG